MDIFKATVDLKKELDTVNSPELDAHMQEIMKLLLGCVDVDCGSKKS